LMAPVLHHIVETGDVCRVFRVSGLFTIDEMQSDLPVKMYKPLCKVLQAASCREIVVRRTCLAVKRQSQT
ncbi:MAG: hypothetical protein LBU06_12485, partial [Desulfovibrio sp.]|nr:hypothetical protein [Desulfovibrio sp.]